MIGMSVKDYYEVLGGSSDASSSEAYYCLSGRKRRDEYDALRCGGMGGGYHSDFAQAHGFDFNETLKHVGSFKRTANKRRQRHSFSSLFDSDDIFDVYAQLSVASSVLNRGGEVRFRHRGKEITLKIKPGEKRGQRFRLKAQGERCPSAIIKVI